MRKSFALLIILLCISPSVLLATDSGNHYGWDKYPGTDTSVSGGVTVGGTTVPIDVPILTTDWTRSVDPVTNIATYGWSLDAPINIMDGSTLVASIDSLDMVVDFDPYVRLNFAVSAYTANTTFTLNSIVVSFPTMSNPLAYASAGMTLTADGDGAWSNGAYAGGESYKALYNGTPLFDSLVGSFTAEAEQTAVNNDRSPLGTGNWTTIAGAVSSIQSQYSFTLSAGDSASGTSRFELKVPSLQLWLCLLWVHWLY